jgi:benzoyl-CoA 2,3-dioxygenase component B
MKQDANEDPRALGGIDLPTVQKYLNMWFTLSLDLFGGEVSSNAADAFAAGLKGRYKEAKYDDHQCLDSVYRVDVVEGGKLSTKEIPYRMAMNEVLRTEYIDDCQRAVNKWNKTIANAGIDFELKLPSRRFHRHIGAWADLEADPDGNLLTAAEWEARKAAWLPTREDLNYVKGLMKPVYERGKIANWVAPPSRGINGQPFDFDYVRFA